jgi:hypothetical protein
MCGSPGLTRRRSLGILAAAAPALLTGCGAGAAGTVRGTGSLRPARPSRPGSAAGVPAWLLASAALAQLAANRKVAQRLSQERVYELVQPGRQPLALAGALPAVIFTSAAQLAGAVRAGALPERTQAVIYDPEAWSFTPAAERRDPVSAAARAARAAHAHGLQFIVAPALNLTTVLAPGSRQARSRLFLQLELAARLAGHADVIEFQAQSLERDAGDFEAFVTDAASQARQANPHIGLLAGVSTNPPGGPVDSGQLVAAIRACQPVVDGFWLNVPRQGPRCLTCGQARPDIGISALLAVL